MCKEGVTCSVTSDLHYWGWVGSCSALYFKFFISDGHHGIPNQTEVGSLILRERERESIVLYIMCVTHSKETLINDSWDDDFHHILSEISNSAANFHAQWSAGLVCTVLWIEKNLNDITHCCTTAFWDTYKYSVWCLRVLSLVSPQFNVSCLSWPKNDWVHVVTPCTLYYWSIWSHTVQSGLLALQLHIYIYIVYSMILCLDIIV